MVDSAYRAGARARIRTAYYACAAREEKPRRKAGIREKKGKKARFSAKIKKEKISCKSAGNDRGFCVRAGSICRRIPCEGEQAAEPPPDEVRRSAPPNGGADRHPAGVPRLRRKPAGCTGQIEQKTSVHSGRREEAERFYLRSGAEWAASTRFSALVTRLSSEVANSG